ncbi:MAG TPA: extracellular solute-binding protein [Candidatus Udaeobacter sp.]|jgi:iron(III) transport system substrate-binding protein|nr:extracellular solute-binding protein [Candidatus Udaeobacter sp.]
MATINRSRLRQFIIVAMLPLVLFGWGGETKAQSKDIVEGAKKEGQLVFYSGIPIPDAQAILSALERKFPFIKTTFYRATGSALVSRIQTEQRAGNHIWDVMNSTGFEPYALLEQGYFAKYDSPERKVFPEGHKDGEGYWATMYTTPMIVSYNTRLVSPGELPKEYFDLLNPKWKGRLGLDASDFEWYANLRKTWGAEKAQKFLEGLRKQDIRLLQGRALLTELLSGGEVAILTNNFLQNAIEAKRKGSPVEMLALDPVISAAGLIGINRLAPHPNAAKLFVDFVLSKEGQELIVKTDRSSVRKDVSGNPLDMIKNVRIIPSDLSLGKNYVQTRDEFRELLGVK